MFLAVRRQAAFDRKVDSVHQHASAFRHIKRRDQTNNGRLSRAGRPHQGRHRPRIGLKAHIVQHFLTRIVSEADVFHRDVAGNPIQLYGPARIGVFLRLVQDFPRALQPGDSLRNLRPNGHNLENRRNQQA